MFTKEASSTCNFSYFLLTCFCLREPVKRLRLWAYLNIQVVTSMVLSTITIMLVVCHTGVRNFAFNLYPLHFFTQRMSVRDARRVNSDHRHFEMRGLPSWDKTHSNRTGRFWTRISGVIYNLTCLLFDFFPVPPKPYPNGQVPRSKLAWSVAKPTRQSPSSVTVAS